MTFLILTRKGFEEWRRQPGHRLVVNRNLLDDAELEGLRAAGIDVHVLPQRLAPDDLGAIERTLRKLKPIQHDAVWVERPAVPQQEDAPEAAARPPAARPQASAAARYSLRALQHLKRLAAAGGKALVIPYMGFGTPDRLFLQGRVLRDEGFATPRPDEKPWRNIVELSKRIGSDEVPGARLLARFDGVEQELVTDAGGYFQGELVLPRPLQQPGWHGVDLELVSPRPRGAMTGAVAQVLVPPPTARYGVISDIDDTVLWSNVTNKLRMLTMLAIRNAHSRKPFKGVTALYAALRDGIGGDEGNPVFYVSSSPWHLYTPLVDFFQAQDIPLGPLMLKQLRLRTMFGAGRHHGHKLENIERIMRIYPDLPFILIGDSGQKDPEIYREVVARHPGRIRVIYIRSVNPDPERIEALDRLIDEVRASGTQLVLVPDSEYAAAHAAAEGLIRPLEMLAVRVDKQADERQAAPPA
ncbi:MAG TPA: phosphatase domain-containing protein [Noviherbaspirillum sp.]|jgi:phosphatidate phosphatase APP1|uniref:App1 family protein n=1 Tax=Noviherbaspirillum sp. TaxID=1926288 RepID=UPI002F95A344